jgi:AcrR family transcriptional regulator
MKHVAQAAGVSRGILHYYFDSKPAILLAALQEVVDDLDRWLGPALGTARDPRTQLRAAIKTFVGMADANREFWLVFVEFWGDMMHDRELAQVNASLYRRLRRTLGALVARSARAGVFASRERMRAP